MKRIITLFAAVAIGSGAYAQIPNGGFESWMNMGSYSMPDQWDQLNAMTASASTFTCMEGTPGSLGTAYIKLVSKTVTGMGVMPGIATCGVLDMSSMSNIQPKSGFPYTSRPAQLTGNWQYMAYGSDQGYISVLLTKWNTSMSMRDTVAYTKQLLSGMAMSWAPFTMNLTYKSAATPDSAIIVLSASGATPVANSYLYADNLAFAGSTTSVASVANPDNTVAVVPNPAHGNATISYTSNAAENIDIQVISIDGRVEYDKVTKVINGQNDIPLDISGLSKGMHIVSLHDKDRTVMQKMIVQ